MPKGKYLFDESKPKLHAFYEDIYANLSQLDVMDLILKMIDSFHDLQKISNAHAGMKKLIDSDYLWPHLRKFLLEAVEQLKEFINSDEMKFVTALTDWPAHAAAELNNLDNLSDKTINEHYQALITFLAKPGVQASNGDTPLHLAAFKGHLETVKVLLLTRPGIDVNKTNNNGDTPLISAVRNGHLETVKVLLAQPGIDVNKASNSRLTTLNFAAYGGHLEIVRLLLAQPGILLNKADQRSKTPLSHAVYNGHLEIVRLLLAQPGIDVNKDDYFGNTPLFWAESRGYSQIALLIQNHIASTRNNATAVLTTPRYTLLRNRAAANNGVASRNRPNNCCLM